MKRISTGALLAIAALWCGPAWSQTRQQAPENALDVIRGAAGAHQAAVTLADVPTTLVHYFNLGPGCRPTRASVRVVMAPAHGAIAAIAGEARPYADGAPLFAPGDPRRPCSARLTPTTDVVYTPAAGYTGDDSAVVEVDEGDARFTDTIALTVLSTPFHASAAAVDCLWQATPAAFKQWADEAPDVGTLMQGAQSRWNPQDHALMDMAAACGVADTPVALSGETAGVAVVMRAVETFAGRRLDVEDQLTDDDLDRAWSQFPAQDREALARQVELSMSSHTPIAPPSPAVLAFAESLHPTHEAAFVNLAVYALARATVEAVTAGR